MNKKKFEKAEIEILYGLNDVITTSDIEVEIPEDWDENYNYGEEDEE
jgi:hypothetical protein